MINYETIRLTESNKIATVSLNRIEKHNAMNKQMILELIDCFGELAENQSIRVVVLRGNGKSFCAGADLNYMKEAAGFSHQENYEDSLQLANCFYKIYTCPKPSIAVIYGAAYGGANGLLAACDFAFCDDETTFSFSEVKIGIVPATISPYIIKRTGEFPARELMLTGKRFKGKDAESYHLINKSLPENELEDYVNETIQHLLTSSPSAIKECKKLIHDITGQEPSKSTIQYTAKIIADIRTSEDGQEGLKAFLEKRKPNWIIS